MQLNVIANAAPMPPETIVLPWWQTPSFCALNLDELYKFLRLKKRGQRTGKTSALHIRAQIKRYEAIANQRDWDEERNWSLAWRRPHSETFITANQLKAYPDWIQTLGDRLRVRPPKRLS